MLIRVLKLSTMRRLFWNGKKCSEATIINQIKACICWNADQIWRDVSYHYSDQALTMFNYIHLTETRSEILNSLNSLLFFLDFWVISVHILSTFLSTFDDDCSFFFSTLIYRVFSGLRWWFRRKKNNQHEHGPKNLVPSTLQRSQIPRGQWNHFY